MRAPGGWPPVIAHAVVTAVTQVLWLTYTPITTDAADSYGVSTTAVTWLANIYPVLYFVLAIPVGMALDRHPRPILVAGAALVMLSALLRLLTGSYGAALSGQLLGAVAQPILFSGIVIVARANLPEAQRPAGIAAGTAGAFAGVVLGLLLPTALADGTELGTLLAVEAALAVAAGSWQLASLRRPIAHDLADDLGAGALRTLWRDPAVRALALVAFAGFGIFATLLTVLQQLLEPRGIAHVTADRMVLAMTLCGIVASVTVPPLAARHGNERRVLVAVSFGGALAAALLGFDLPVWALSALLVAIGALLLPGLPILLELGERRHAAAGGTVSSIVFLAGNLGVALLTIVSTALDASQWLPFVAIAAGALLALTLARPGLATLDQR